ncbi:MAG: hypothetical protein M1834_007697 [Cirrosporium novae-zelandiae]|nr:MAG: hypothetical protein M1834_007697 [Cirrosporium novae-zelandiae]
MNTLSILLTTFSLLPGLCISTDFVQQFGLVGPQNLMLLLNGFHFISGHSDQYLQANHHCVVMSSEFIQCAIYVPGTNPARLAGVEYIITGEAFAKLPYEEKQLWHSHMFEVSSGYLLEPGTPDNVDHAIMEILVNSYGKTWHTWPYDSKNESLPLGIPDLVNGYTGGGQLPDSLVEERDDDFGTNTTATKIAREDLTVPTPQAGADAWKDGIILTLSLHNATGNTTF